ncbi:MAG: hypothetical protein WBW31_12235 [Candidatus Sulfotelmatobacter sp.]
MRTIVEQFISLPSKIASELEQIKSELASIRRASDSRKEQEQRQPIVVSASLSRTQAEIDQDERSRIENRHYQNRNLAVQCAIAGVTLIVAIASLMSAVAAKQSSDTGARQLELAERPWVFISGSELTTPITFDKDGGHVTMKFVFTNSGRSPAINVGVSPELFVLTNEHSSVGEERDRLCNPSGPAPAVPGMVLFPGTTAQEIRVGINRADMEKAARQGGGTFTSVPIVCIVYRPNFKDAWYYTAIPYSLWPLMRLEDTVRKDYSVPINQIDFRPNSFFGEIAK